jgi:hypothetical protein
MTTVRRVVPGRAPSAPKTKAAAPAAESAEPKNDPVFEASPAHLEYETSPEIDKIAKAFVAFRSTCPNVDKDRDGYNYKYATLGNIIGITREHLKKNNLAVMQFPIAGNKAIGVITTLLHESGQFIRARFLMPIPTLSGTNVTQDAGAAITYARRYALAAVLSIASDEDTDASYAVKRK